MNKLRGMFLFSRLAELGSFVAVAEEIDSTASMVSKEIQKLEQDIGARLLHRSTRKIQLTPVGEGYLERCRQILAQVNEADAYVQQSQNSMRGKLRINMPMVLGLTDLSLVIADYMRTYPDVELDIHLGDESVDLLEGGFDLGFRASSQLLDSGYVGKPLKAFDYHICAAPQYLKTHAPIKTVQDLTQHNCFEYSYFKGGKVWPVAQGINIKGNLKANNTLMIRDAVEAGLGLAFLPGFVAKPGLDSGRLQEVLKEQPKPKLTLYALYPNRKHLPPALSKFIEFIQNWFAKSG
ncbi:LysR substrate-binding domain-containing protein [Planctobacterium marinum]|uniref:LysR substrate-binding domain-containing protein n=1 Tax=Planctobacterium marinum TaxID=1631968 RepID=UPI001E43B178|nr:LysR substrate-binding domain-containing protein [Planctobacterium marinum]MCC2604630.1 LysR family transcriptional regulator [Planctobacterium marinum]